MKLSLSLFSLLGLLVSISATNAETVRQRSIVDFGAVGDGERINTLEIQSAIDSLHVSGGGRLVVPKGTFVSGALFLKQGVALHLAEGAMLQGSSNIADFPTCMTRIEGKVQPWRPALINAVDLEDVNITGPGILDGNGEPYWRAFWKRRSENSQCTNLEVERPRLLYFENCQGVEVRELNLKDSAFWNLHVYRCTNVLLEKVMITAPHGAPPRIVGEGRPWNQISIARAPSSDGIDVDSCQGVVIRCCTISVGDDCIALKGTKGPNALEDEASPPVQNIVIEDCDFYNGHGVLTCGSEATIVQNVVVRNCRVGAGVPVCRLKLRPDTPQLYENLLFENLTLNGAQAIFDVKPWTQFFDLQGKSPPQSTVRNVSLRGITGTVGSLGELRGNEGDVIQNVVLENFQLNTHTKQFRRGSVQGLQLNNVMLNGSSFEIE